MLQLLLSLKQAVNRLLEWLLIVAVTVMTVVVLWGVVTRFVFSDPSNWTEEVATNLLIWVSLLGAAVAFGRQEHLGLDYFVLKFDPAAQRLVAVVGQVVVLLFAASAMVFGGYVLVSETLAADQVTAVLGMKVGYIYLAVPVSGLFICLYCVERLVELFRGAPPIPTPSTTSGSEVE